MHLLISLTVKQQNFSFTSVVLDLGSLNLFGLSDAFMSVSP